MDEFTRIATFFAPLATHPGAWGLKDDAAELDVPAGKKLVVTQDTLVESVHFLGDEAPGLLARKALRVNLSDLAAKGAEPLGYLLSLSLPERCDDAWLAAFAKGLHADQKTYGLSLLGGDSTRSPDKLVITITALGTTTRTVRRSGAQTRDLLFVTGTIGDAFLGLQVAQKRRGHDEMFLARYQLPEPRVAFANTIANYATAALDVSDGLLQDAQHLARESGLRLQLDLDRVPVSAAEEILALATGGDDYEILFTAPKTAREALQKAAENVGIRLTQIGYCAEGDGLHLSLCGEGVPLPESLGWKHR